MTHFSLNGTLSLRECPEMRAALAEAERRLPKDINVYERPSVARVPGTVVVGIHGSTEANWNETTIAVVAVQSGLGPFATVPARFEYYTDEGRTEIWIGEESAIEKAASEHRVAKAVRRLKKLTADELDEVMRALQ